MPKKLTHEFVFKYYNDNNYILNSIYKHALHKDKLTCPVGHEIEMTFGNFKTGYRCGKCFGSEKFSHEYVSNYYKNENYTMKSIYNGGNNKDSLICPNGHEIKMLFNNFKNNNSRCLKCSGKEQYSNEYVENFIKSEGWIKISTVYKNNKTKLELICPNGHVQFKTFESFKKGKRCKQCYFENNIGENHPKFKEDRTRTIRVKYLQFDLNKLYILQDDPLYDIYIQSQMEAKLQSTKDWSRTEYNVDHIFPRIAFIDNNLDKIYNQTIVKEICNMRENLRIISKNENGSKSGKYNQEEFIEWFINKYNDHVKT